MSSSAVTSFSALDVVEIKKIVVVIVVGARRIVVQQINKKTSPSSFGTVVDIFVDGRREDAVDVTIDVVVMLVVAVFVVLVVILVNILVIIVVDNRSCVDKILLSNGATNRPIGHGSCTTVAATGYLKDYVSEIRRSIR